MGEEDRSAREVFDDHLPEASDGSVEADISRNYAEDVVLLCSRGVYRGHDGVRRLAQMLKEPDA